MLASNAEDGGFDARRFSLAGDIVELVVLSTDEVFLETLRDAVGGARRLWHVSSADKVSDLLLAGQVGILVLDVQALVEAPIVFIAQIKRQFPDLVVVVAGNRDAEPSLAGSISDGIVYRFIHKPMSPGRAKLFADAAVKKYAEQRRRTAAAPAVSRKPRTRVLIGAAIGIGAIILAAWAIQTGSDDNSGAPRASDIPRAPAVQSRQPPDATAARAAVAEVRERLLARAENALLAERLDEAAAAIDTARRSGVESGRISFLTAQLAKSREHVKAAHSSARALIPPKGSMDTVTPLLTLATQRMEQARLVEPESDSALFYIREALRLDPNNDAAVDAEQALAMRLLAESHAAVERRDFAQASAWLEAAKGIAAAVNIESAEASLAAARRRAGVEAAPQAATVQPEHPTLQPERPTVQPEHDTVEPEPDTVDKQGR